MGITLVQARGLCVAGLLATLAPSSALAAGVSPRDASALQRSQATDHFAAGKQAAEEHRWDDAVDELRASLDIVNSPNTRLVLARALRDSGRPGEAWTEYGRVVADVAGLAGSDARYARTAEAATVERQAVEARLAEDASGQERARSAVSVAAGDHAPAVSEPPASADPARAPPTRGPPDTPDPSPTSTDDARRPWDRTGLRPYAYVAGGVGAAGLLTFAVLGGLNDATFGDLRGACAQGACPPDKIAEIQRGRMQQTAANIGLGVGLAGVAAGAALFVVSLPPKTSGGASAALVVAPGYVGLRGAL